ncbi:hypothetical protein GQ607_000188, partial [Colletotrichum asianum]
WARNRGTRTVRARHLHRRTGTLIHNSQVSRRGHGRTSPLWKAPPAQPHAARPDGPPTCDSAISCGLPRRRPGRQWILPGVGLAK